jgi:SAM-dependent methyltransferase
MPSSSRLSQIPAPSLHGRGRVSSPAYEPAHCVVCGHAESTVLAEPEDIRAEVETLWAYHERRLRTGTPTERLMDRVAFSERPPYRLVQCADCGLVYRNPTEREHELRAIYTRQAPAHDVMRALHDTQAAAMRGQASFLRRLLGGSASGLEVGSYVGAFLAAARHAGLSFEGLDINPDVNAFVRSLGFAVHDGDLGSFEPARAYDVVAIWNTFDQLADPRGAVGRAWRLLAPNGVLAIRVPNGAFYAAQRRHLASRSKRRRRIARLLLAQNNLLSFPYRWGFTPRSLRRLLESGGFTVQRLRGDVLVPTADEWTRWWARVEEIAIKRVIAWSARRGASRAPWFEVYATRRA